MKNTARALILGSLISSVAHSLTAQRWRGSVSYDYQHLSWASEPAVHAHGAYFTTSYDLLSAGDDIERAFALHAGFGVQGYREWGRPEKQLVGKQVVGGVGAALFFRANIIEFQFSAVPGFWYGSGSIPRLNLRTVFGLTTWLQQDFGLQAGVGVDMAYYDDIHGFVGIAIRSSDDRTQSRPRPRNRRSRRHRTVRCTGPIEPVGSNTEQIQHRH